MSFWIGLVIGLAIGHIFGHRISRRLAREHSPTHQRAEDFALIVGFLQAYGPSSVLDIRLGMDEFSRGLHDWSLKSRKSVFQMLRTMESDGTITSHTTDDHREWELVAPSSRLVQVD